MMTPNFNFKRIFYFMVLFSCLTFTVGLCAQENQGMVLVKTFEKEPSITVNHGIIADALEEFEESARFMGIDYEPKFHQIESIRFEPGNLSFQTKVEGGKITLNAIYTEFPNLARVMIFQAIGEFYGLKKLDDGWFIMSEKWKINPRHEGYAWTHRHRNVQMREYLEKLARKHPLKIRI